jgi:hypothetical protein
METMRRRIFLLVRNIILWAAIGCTMAGLVSMFIPDSAGTLLYLVGFPLLCVILFF